MEAVLRFILLVIILLNGKALLLAQPAYNTCANALELCPNNPISVNNINANKSLCVDCEDDFNFCFTANNTIWLKFKTNASGGNVQLDFANLVFENNPGQSQIIQASLINTVSPCTANSYSQLGNCISNGTTSFTLSANNLAANTTFYVVLNGDKYPILETTIKKGTPYVQIIPFKRDSWKMVIKSREQKEVQNSRLFYGLKVLNLYKDKYWNKKSWK